jgi:hypothetical protein
VPTSQYLETGASKKPQHILSLGASPELWTFQRAIHGLETSVHRVLSVSSNEARMEQATSKSLRDSNPTDMWDEVQRAKTWPGLAPADDEVPKTHPIPNYWRNP